MPQFFKYFFLFLLVGTTAIAQKSDVKDLEFFEGDQDSALYTKLITDLAKFRKDRNKDSVQGATWGFFLSETDSVELKVKLTPRGNFRRSHCMITPFKVNFKSSDFANSTVAGHDKLKVVTHCRNTPAYQQNLFLEFLIYKAYEELSQYSYRVKLLNMTYYDKGKKKTKVSQNYAFFIEDIDQVAERNDAVEVETKMLSFNYFEPFDMVLADFFQFMIGNTDYSIPHLHNIKLLKLSDPNKPYPIIVPYDFDYCGLIDANYAVPNEQLGISDVRERLYRGVCVDRKYFDQARQHFLDKEDAIMKIFTDYPLLDDLNRKKAVDYVKQFYDILKSDRAYENTIVAHCRKI